MEIILGKTAGLCFGVKNAVENANEELSKSDNLYCLGELVHNEELTKELEEKGMRFIENISEAQGKVVIRAHGEPERTYQEAKKIGLEVIDLTCPKVAKIHKIVKEYTLNDYYIFITGKPNHPEVIGIAGFCDNNYSILESQSDIEQSIEKFKTSKYDKAILISQTTFSMEKFQIIQKEILANLGNDILETINTICTATKIRQEETLEISKRVEVMIIIGGKHSSNTAKLYDIAKENCPTYFVQTADELEIEEIKKYKIIGIMAGASTPYESIKKVIDKLEKI